MHTMDGSSGTPIYTKGEKKCQEYGCNHEATKGEYGREFCTCHWNDRRIVPCPEDEGRKRYEA